MVEQGRELPVSSVGLPTYNYNNNYKEYPAALAKYEDVVGNPQLFMTTLEKLHASMSTKFMIPIIGGRDLDLHKLFVEVTSRGGIENILREKRWKDVTATFNFPSTATNASFVLRKYYYSLLQHYERIYYFKAQGWTPSSSPAGAMQSPSATPVTVHERAKISPTPVQVATIQQPKTNTIEFVSGASTTPSSSSSTVGSPVIGVIDGKFESGYLVTVTIGKEKLKGVLYQVPRVAMNHHQEVPQTCGGKTTETSGMQRHSGRRRRKRRKKSEIRKRDPCHPKPNRSGYNLFFAEQHARLKPLHPGKDREISRMIGELWNKLKENDKSVYQEKAIKDKERYRREMEEYRERLKGGNQVISDAVPIQQRFPPYLEVHNRVVKSRDSPQTPPENESNSSKSESESEDGDDDDDDDNDNDDITDKDDDDILSDTETSLPPPPPPAAAVAEEFQVVKGDGKGVEEREGRLGVGS